jgi:aerobic carbon-monoxide dehydrogenase large subunit
MAMTYVGKHVPSLTNAKLVAGKGMFVDDISLPRMAYAAILRSPYAHARIRSVDVSRAESLPGVLCAVTGTEVRESMNPIPETYDTAAVGAKGVKWYALCVDRARYVGEAVAAVVAEDKFTAYAALDLVEVDYEELPVVADPEEAMKEGAPLVEPDWGDNIMASRDIVLGDPDTAFAEADGTISGSVRSSRITGTAIEPRGCVASYDPYEGTFTFWDSTQNPHPLRNYISGTLGVPETSIRVIQPHVGGGFGLKIPTFQEEPLVAYLSRKLGRPVKWIEERSENFQTGGHARDTRFRYEAAYKYDGTVTGIRLEVIADVGAPSALCGWGMSFVTWYCLPCVYKIPNSETHLRSVVTNKCPWNAYRGYGKDAASFLMDRIMDHVAKETGHDRAAIRFANFIPPEEFPFPQVSGAMIDSGAYADALRAVLEMIDYEGFGRVQEEARREGRYLGLGIGQELIPEGCSMPGSLLLNGTDGTEVRVSPTGEVTVLTGVTSPGSGNETGIAQIVADAVGCKLERIRVIQGDTQSCPWGFGNYSARSIIIGGSAAHLAATEIREKMLRVAANMLEAASEDLEAADGSISVRGAPERSLTIDEVAAEVYRNPHGPNMEGIEPALEAQRHFRIGNVYHQPEKQGRFSAYPSWPNGVAACIVEVDPETGFVEILRFCMVHDAGTIVNPLLAEANLHGGIAQGIGAALYEKVAYDEMAQPLTATFMDYTIPTAIEVPRLELGHQETPTPFTPLGTKGVGESGVGAPLGALCSAVENALPELDMRLTELPLTPSRVWEAIQEARAKREAGEKAAV